MLRIVIPVLPKLEPSVLAKPVDVPLFIDEALMLKAE